MAAREVARAGDVVAGDVAAAAHVPGGAAGEVAACIIRGSAANTVSAVTVFKLEFLCTVRQPTALMACINSAPAFCASPYNIRVLSR